MTNHNLNKQILNIVNLYNNNEEVIKYAKQLEMQSISEQITLVVVINAMEDSTFESIKNNLKEVNLDTHIFNPKDNLGYLNGALYGYRKYIENNDAPKWSVISNTDVEFSNNNFFEDFLNFNYSQDTWLIGPSVYSLERKTYDNPHYMNRNTKKGIKSRMKLFSKPRLLYYYKKLFTMKSLILKKKKEESKFVYSVHGCFQFLDNKLMEILSRKNYGVKMYSEEAYLSEIVLLNNKRCYYNSEIEIIHHESTATSKLGASIKSEYIVDSLNYILNEFYLNDPGEIYVE